MVKQLIFYLCVIHIYLYLEQLGAIQFCFLSHINDALNTFYLWLYGIKHMVTDHSDSKRGNPLMPPHGLLFPISSKGSFICIIPQTGYYIPRPLLCQSWSTGWNENTQLPRTATCCNSFIGYAFQLATPIRHDTTYHSFSSTYLSTYLSIYLSTCLSTYLSWSTGWNYKQLGNSVMGERGREMFYLTMHSTHFIYGYMASDIW